ncbi:MAG: hypothetical protein A4S09_14710 [Proteobacteria bacterium SG_bin7]|nr:MAG: hypothetical protein A4S09_14710 [Proteobacteria bacterium SG_bin7]
MDTGQDTVPAPRIRLFVDVEYRKSYSRKPASGILKNISLTGAFLETSDTLIAKDKVVVTFQVSGRERRVPATVIWTGEKGAGIKFQPANNRDIQIVDDLMYFVSVSRDSQKDVLDTIFKKVG